jgi:hypothetical protein
MKRFPVQIASGGVLSAALLSLGSACLFQGPAWVCLFLVGCVVVFGLVFISTIVAEQSRPWTVSERER